MASHLETQPAIAQQYVGGFAAYVQDLLTMLEKNQWVTSEAEAEQSHTMSKANVKEISSWVKTTKLRYKLLEAIETVSHQDPNGQLDFAQLALRLLHCLEMITETVLKRSMGLHWIILDRGARLNRYIRLEQGLLQGLYRDVSQRQAKLVQINTNTQTITAGPEMILDSCSHAQQPLHDPWTKLRVLALGGTFFQALSGLHVLARIMEYVADEELASNPKATSSSSSPLYSPLSSSEPQKRYDFRPCHYFDRVCGSGVSGISAIMLGTMRFSVSEATQMMHTILDSAFEISRRINTPANSHTENADTLAKVLRDTLEGPDKNALRESKAEAHKSAEIKAEQDQCQTLCITAMKAGKNEYLTHLLRPYDKDSELHTSKERTSVKKVNEYSHSEELPIVLTCQALLASQTHSKVKIRGEARKFKDTRSLGINPAWEAYKEASDNRGNGSASLELLCCIDSGTSIPDKKLMSLAQNRYHQELECLMSGSFYLFEPETPSHSSSHTFTKLKDHIETEAKRYCSTRESSLRSCANHLVQARRVRAQTGRWSKFAGLKISRAQ